MTPKQYLSRYQEINRDINALVEDCARLRSLAQKVTPEQSDGLPKGTNPDKAAPFTRIIEQIVAKEAEINGRIDDLMVARDEISATIDAVEVGVLRRLLRYRYLCGLTWEQIAVEMHYTYQWVCILHGKALQEVIVDSN